VMIRFFGPAAIFLTLAFVLAACETDPEASSPSATSFSTQSNSDTGSTSMGFQGLKMGGGGGSSGGGSGGGGGY
jgi:starvation-inducible outer membrane lipoprotein